MNDALKIFELYLESIEEEQPQMSTSRYGTKSWHLHDKLHRVDGPAVEYADGEKVWYLHDKKHRVGGPAVEYADGGKEWWQHGKRHREDGPAGEWSSGRKEWYLNGVEYSSPEQWAEALLKQRNKPHDAMAVDAFLKTLLRKDIEMAL